MTNYIYIYIYHNKRRLLVNMNYTDECRCDFIYIEHIIEYNKACSNHISDKITLMAFQASIKVDMHQFQFHYYVQLVFWRS